MISLNHMGTSQQQGFDSDHKMMPWPSLGEGDMGMGVEGMDGDEVNFDEFLNVGEDDEEDVDVNGNGFGGPASQTTSTHPAGEGQNPEGVASTSSIPTVDAAELEADRSSSLSPVPADAAEPESKPQPTDGSDAAKDANTVDSEKKEDEGDDDAEKIPSRMSTPLSPLSPPPEDDEDDAETNGKDEDKKEEDSTPATSTNSSAKASGPATRSTARGQGQRKGPPASNKANANSANHPNNNHNRGNIGNPEVAAAVSGKMGNVPSSGSASTGMTQQQLQQLGQQQHHQSHLIANSLSASTSAGSHQFGQQGIAGKNGYPGGMGMGMHGGMSGLPHSDGATGAQESDPKVALLLELNAELFSICMAFQQRGIPLSDHRYQHYTGRIQANLTFLASHAETQNAPLTVQQQRHAPHPPLEPPIPLDFVSTDRIRQLYAELPSVFAKEIARRQQLNMMMSVQQRSGQNISIAPSPASAPTTGLNGVVPPNINPGLANSSSGTSSSPSPSSSNHLKRERTEEHMAPDGIQSISNKRRDTGENKGMMPPPTSIPINSEGANGGDNLTQQQRQQQMMQQRAQQQNGVQGSPRLQQPTPGQPGPPGHQRTQTPSQQRPASQQSIRPNSASARQSPVQSINPSPGPGSQQGDHLTSPSSMMNANLNEAQMVQAQRAKQMSMRAAQQGQGGPMGPQGGMGGAGRQMSPPGAQGMGPQGMGGGNINISGQGNAGGVNVSQLDPRLQQAYTVLQTPGHPFVAHVMSVVRDFRQLPLQMQLTRMVQVHQHDKARKEAAMRQNMMGGGNAAGGMPNNAGGGMGMALGGGSSNPAGFNQMNMGMGGGNAPSSPVAPQQNLAMFNNMGGSGSGGMMGGGGGGGGTMDPRMLQGGGGGGGVPGANMGGMNMGNMNSMTPQQQQQLLLMQRARMGGGGQGGGGGMGGGNPQQNMALMQDPQRLRALQEQRAAQQQAQLQSIQGIGSPMLSQQNLAGMGGGGGMAGGMGNMGGGNGDFPAVLRSNPQVQGISRNAWSPTGDGNSTPSPMTPRVPSGGPGGMSQQEYNRMLLQQQQMQASRAMAGSPAFGGQQGGGMSAGWQQKQQQGMMGGGGGGGSSMSPPGGGGGGFGGGNAGMAPSPPNNSQGWGGAASGGYPFGGSSGMDPMRNMSATPGPQQGGGMMGPPQMGGDAGAGGIVPEFSDLFNWNGPP